MKKLFIILSLLITISASAQPTQINGNQIKDQAITNAKIKNDAGIHHSKINFTGIVPATLGLEGPLTFNAPLSKTSLSVSLSTITVPFGGTGLTTVGEGLVPFGNSATSLDTSTAFSYIKTTETLSLTNLKVSGGTPAIGYVLTSSDIEGNLVFTNPASVIPTNTIITDNQVVVGTGTSIEGTNSFLFDGTTVTLPNLKVTGGTPTVGYVLAVSNVDGTLSYSDPASVIPTNTIITDNQVVVGTGTSIEGAGTGLIYNGTSLGIPGGVDFYDTIVDTVGLLQWNNTDGTLDLNLKGGATTLQIGQETLLRVYNNTGSPLTNGQVVFVSGSQGSSRATVSLAKADSLTTLDHPIGIVIEPILAGEEGFITTFGFVRNFDTDALTEGATVYVSPTIAGGLTTTKPSPPYIARPVGTCINKNASTGVLSVAIGRIEEYGHFTYIQQITTTKAPDVTEVANLFTNEGDTDGAVITLPTATSGLVYTMYVQTGQSLTITASSGDTIRIAGSVTTAAGSITSNSIGTSITLVAINDTEWVATSVIGTWSF